MCWVLGCRQLGLGPPCRRAPFSAVILGASVMRREGCVRSDGRVRGPQHAGTRVPGRGPVQGRPAWPRRTVTRRQMRQGLGCEPLRALVLPPPVVVASGPLRRRVTGPDAHFQEDTAFQAEMGWGRGCAPGGQRGCGGDSPGVHGQASVRVQAGRTAWAGLAGDGAENGCNARWRHVALRSVRPLPWQAVLPAAGCHTAQLSPWLSAVAPPGSFRRVSRPRLPKTLFHFRCTQCRRGHASGASRQRVTPAPWGCGLRLVPGARSRVTDGAPRSQSRQLACVPRPGARL